MVQIFLKKIKSKLFKKKKKAKEWSKPRRNCLSKIFFWWTLPTLIKGYKTYIKKTDILTLLPEYESSGLGDRLEQEWSKVQLVDEKPSLWGPLCKLFLQEFICTGIIIFINEIVIKLSQPVFIWKLITTHDKDIHQSYIYAFLIVVTSFINVILNNWTVFSLRVLSMKMRVACSSIIYRKSLKLNRNTIKNTATGKIVNLLSNDLNRLDKLFIQIHYIWIAPVETVIICYLLYVILDLSAAAGLGLFFIFIPFQILMGQQYSGFRLKTALKTDERVRLLSEIISGIQVIKMYTWEKIFTNLISNLRKQEIRYIRGTAYLKAVQNAFNSFISKGAVFTSILVYILTGNLLTSQYVFVIKSFYTLLKKSMTSDFPEAIKNIAEASISVKRIENFLLTDEVELNETQNPLLPPGVFLEKASAKWLSSPEALSVSNFCATSGKVVALVGTIGSGKSSLINIILQELSLTRGALTINGRISYCCQNPWLFAGTIRENIIFGQPFDVQRYNEVVRVCALDYDFQFLHFGDNSFIGDNGTTLSGGQKARISLARAIYKYADIYVLDDPLAAVDPSTAKQLFEGCILGYLKDKCVILATHQVQYLQKSDWIYVLKDGKIVTEGNFDYIRNSCDFFGTFENECEDELSKTEEKTLKTDTEKQFGEYSSSGPVSGKIYRRYLLSAGWCYFILLLIMCVFCQCVQSGVDYFESYWVKLEQSLQPSKTFFTTENCVYIYSALICSILVSSVITSMLFYSYFIKTSVKLHNVTFLAIIQASLQFYHVNSTGAVLNRFSKDLGSADFNVPKFLFDTIQNGLNVLAVFLIVGIVDFWMLLPSTFLLMFFYCIRKFYLATSRELKRIEAISRSPIYSHLNESLQGLETIRAFAAQKKQKQRFHHLLDENTSVFYLYLALSNAFCLWLSLFCSFYVALVSGSCFWGKGKSTSQIGLIITQATGLADLLSWGMVQWSELENEMTSIERIFQYKEVEPEESSEINDTPWPMCNSVHLKNVTLKYKDNTPAVLNNVDLEVNPYEKIGIVGRTGAGKSSIISALFRLVKFDGAIFVGDVNINNLSLQTLRSHISIIPQNPVLFSGTVRDNLDPFRNHSDYNLWSILDNLGLKTFVNQFPEGLDSLIVEKGANLSVGQRQLFCLARALLRRNKILVLDEATASIDYTTDALIQSTIRKKLVNCTVLIIAHRLHTIMKCDKIMVMDAGAVLEVGHPYTLLENEDSALYKLVAKGGPQMIRQLKEVAKENYGKCT